MHATYNMQLQKRRGIFIGQIYQTGNKRPEGVCPTVFMPFFLRPFSTRASTQILTI